MAGHRLRGAPINVYVYPRAEHDEAAIADMVSRRLAFTLGPR